MRTWKNLAGVMMCLLMLGSTDLGYSGIARGATENLPQTMERPDQCRGSVALTFDDGPDADLTPKALDVLKAYDVKATFFVLGSHVEGNEAIIRRMVEEGHSVQDHTWDHPYLTDLDDGAIVEQVQRTSQEIQRAGAPAPAYVRPPYGDYDARVVGIIEQEGFQIVTWTNALDIRDWDGPASPEQIVERVRNNVQDGGVILIHDIQENTVEAIPEIIGAIYQEGYCVAPFRGEQFWKVDA